MKKQILIIKHPEAKKNLADIIGGQGSPLTDRGIMHSLEISKYILKNFHVNNRSLLVGHNVQQVKQTLEILSNELKLQPILDERLKALNLGILSALSTRNAMEKWPDSARNLILWRNGKLKINELNIPSAEPLDQFKARVNSILSDWIELKNTQLIIGVCTTSVLIMLFNLVKLWQNFSYDQYSVYDVSPGTILKINVHNKFPNISELLKSGLS